MTTADWLRMGIELGVLLLAGAAAFFNLKGDVRVLQNDIQWMKQHHRGCPVHPLTDGD